MQLDELTLKRQPSAFAIALFHSATAFCASASASVRLALVIPSVIVSQSR